MSVTFRQTNKSSCTIIAGHRKIASRMEACFSCNETFENFIDKPEAKSQSKAQDPTGPKKEKRNLASGLVTKILWAIHPTHHPTTHNF